MSHCISRKATQKGFVTSRDWESSTPWPILCPFVWSELSLHWMLPLGTHCEAICLGLQNPLTMQSVLRCVCAPRLEPVVSGQGKMWQGTDGLFYFWSYIKHKTLNTVSNSWFSHPSFRNHSDGETTHENVLDGSFSGEILSSKTTRNIRLPCRIPTRHHGYGCLSTFPNFHH